MLPAVAHNRPSYSVRLLRPFIKVVRGHPAITRELLEPMEALDSDDRLPIDMVHELLRGLIALTGEPYVGLRAARAVELGEFGALEYVASSAANLRGAIDVVGRYMGLVNDALRFELEERGELAILNLESTVELPMAAETFEVGAFYVALNARFDTLQERPPYTVHFRHARPDDVTEYERTFPGATLRFESPFTGFSLGRDVLETPLPTHDPRLHELLRKHADLLLAELPRVESFVERVRERILGELSGGNPGVKHIASTLHLSPRTLARRLEQHGTSFKDLLDELRRGLALRYAAHTDLQLSEIALLLGFANSASFHRAFRRWTGETPLEYRRAHRFAPAAP